MTMKATGNSDRPQPITTDAVQSSSLVISFLKWVTFDTNRHGLDETRSKIR